jgi:hypothetical protein
MDHSRRDPSYGAAVLAVAVVLAAGCQKQSQAKSNTADRAALVAQAINPTPPPGGGVDSTRPQATLTVLSPDTLVVAHRKPQPVTFQVQYTITQPALVKRAVLQLWNDAVGVIDTTVLPAQSEGNGTWSLPKPLSIGPLVLFSARCPGGETVPFVWGASARPTDANPAIITVTPTHVPEEIPDDPNPAHVGIPVMLWGNGLGPGCTVSAKIDKRTITLDTRPQGANRLAVFVKRSDLGSDAIYTRWFELKFLLRGPHAGTEAVAKVPVAVAE